MQQRHEEGREGLCRAVIALMESRFGTVPPELHNMLNDLSEPPLLRRETLRAESLSQPAMRIDRSEDPTSN